MRDAKRHRAAVRDVKRQRAAQKTAHRDIVDVTRRASELVATVRQRAAAHAARGILALWGRVNPHDRGAVDQFAVAAAKIMRPAQDAVARAAAAAVSNQLAAMGIRVTATPTSPLDVRAPQVTIADGHVTLDRRPVTVDYGDGQRHITAQEYSTEGIFGRPATVFRHAAAQDDTNAGQLARDRVMVLVEDNLMLAQRIAEHETLAQADHQQQQRATQKPVNLEKPAGHESKIIGWRRVIHPELSRGGSCGMCIVATRQVYKVDTLRAIHSRCRCTVAPVTAQHDPGSVLNHDDLQEMYAAAGGTTAAHLKRTRYQYKQEDHGEFSNVLTRVISGANNRRSTSAERSRAVADHKPETTRPTRLSDTDFAKHQISVLEENLPRLYAQGMTDDDDRVKYHKKMIAKFRKDVGLAADTASANASRKERVPEVASGSGSNRPPTKPPTGGQSIQGDAPDGWSGHIKGYVHPHKLSVWSEAERVRRQAAIGIVPAGEQLYQHEIESVERMQKLGQELGWIKRTDKHATNDAIWINNGGIAIELKATKAKQANINQHIVDCFKQAEAAERRGDQVVNKVNFVIDLGQSALTDTLKNQISRFNERRRGHSPPRQIKRLWVLSQGNLIEIYLK